MKIAPISLAKRIEKWQKVLAPLGVAHWRFKVVLADSMPGAPSAQMAVIRATDYDMIEIHVYNDWLKGADAEDLDQAIIHEWVHVAMRDFDDALEQVESWMPEKTYEDFDERIKHEREGLVDRIAWGLYYAHKGQKPRFSP